jgi:hypothetical protein
LGTRAPGAGPGSDANQHNSKPTTQWSIHANHKLRGTTMSTGPVAERNGRPAHKPCQNWRRFQHRQPPRWT